MRSFLTLTDADVGWLQSLVVLGDLVNWFVPLLRIGHRTAKST